MMMRSIQAEKHPACKFLSGTELMQIICFALPALFFDLKECHSGGGPVPIPSDYLRTCYDGRAYISAAWKAGIRRVRQGALRIHLQTERETQAQIVRVIFDLIRTTPPDELIDVCRECDGKPAILFSDVGDNS